MGVGTSSGAGAGAGAGAGSTSDSGGSAMAGASLPPAAKGDAAGANDTRTTRSVSTTVGT
jgi:hypothetical protein